MIPPIKSGVVDARGGGGCSRSSTSRLTGHPMLSLRKGFVSTKSSSITLFMAALPDGYQDFGNFVIRKVASEQFGMQTEEDLTIEWKPGRIVVTIMRSNVYVSNDMEENFEDIDIEESDDFEEYDDEYILEEEDEEVEEEEEEEEEEVAAVPPQGGVDVTQLARAINAALDDDVLGLQIAETFEIEVTTPGASNELSGIMFESYKGFEVLTEFQDPKTKKVKTIEGRLVERNNEFTVINIKGRIKKIKNDMVLTVKLPKAKKEKGAA
jgi:hypothetical protein